MTLLWPNIGVSLQSVIVSAVNFFLRTGVRWISEDRRRLSI
jgi:hypothetical protein